MHCAWVAKQPWSEFQPEEKNNTCSQAQRYITCIHWSKLVLRQLGCNGTNDVMWSYVSFCLQGNRYDQEKLLTQSNTLYVGNLSFYTTEEQVGCHAYHAYTLQEVVVTACLWHIVPIHLHPSSSNRCTSCFRKVETSNALSLALIRSRRLPVVSAL